MAVIDRSGASPHETCKSHARSVVRPCSAVRQLRHILKAFALPCIALPDRTVTLSSELMVLHERYETCPGQRIAIRQAILCGDAPLGLPRPVLDVCPRDDGGQHRARHQLLDGVSEISFTGLGRFRHRVALAAVPAVLGRLRRACRPLRSAPPDPDRHGPVHRRIAELELFLRHRHPADVAGDGDPGDPRLRRGAMADAEPDAAVRHRRADGSGERGAAQRDGALPRRPGRAGRGRRHPAGVRASPRHHAQHRVLSAAGALARERALWSTLPHRHAGAAPRRPRT